MVRVAMITAMMVDTMVDIMDTTTPMVPTG